MRSHAKRGQSGSSRPATASQRGTLKRQIREATHKRIELENKAIATAKSVGIRLEESDALRALKDVPSVTILWYDEHGRAA